jgi:hypothetical protein
MAYYQSEPPTGPTRGRRTGRGDDKPINFPPVAAFKNSALFEVFNDGGPRDRSLEPTGTKKAVLIGLDYSEEDEDEDEDEDDNDDNDDYDDDYGPRINTRTKPHLLNIRDEDAPTELNNAIGDTFGMRIDINLTNDYPFDNIRIYTEVETDHGRPNRDGILRAIKWLTRGAKSGDSLLFYFAGHGRYDDEKKQSWIVTLDNEMISGSELRHYLVDSLPAGCRLTAVFDCCYSGNILDLKYSYSSLNEMRTDTPHVGNSPARASVLCWTPVNEQQAASDGESTEPGSGYFSNAFFRAQIQSYNSKYTSVVQRLPKEQTPMLCSSFRIAKDNTYYL